MKYLFTFTKQIVALVNSKTFDKMISRPARAGKLLLRLLRCWTINVQFLVSSRTTFQLTNDVRAFLRKPRSIDDIKV